MKLKFKKLQTISETITVEFGNRSETYSKNQFDDLLENGIEFTEDDLGDKDIAGIQLKTNVNGLEKIKDFKNGVDFYIEGKNDIGNAKLGYVENFNGILDLSRGLTPDGEFYALRVPTFDSGDSDIKVKCTYKDGSILELVGKCESNSASAQINWNIDGQKYLATTVGARTDYPPKYGWRQVGIYTDVYPHGYPINIEFFKDE